MTFTLALWNSSSDVHFKIQSLSVGGPSIEYRQLLSSNTSCPHQAEAVNIHQAEGWKGISSLLQFKSDGCFMDLYFVFCKLSLLERD